MYPGVPLQDASCEMRLLEIEPATKYDAPMVCKLRNVPLGSRPLEEGLTYEALSYTWGRPNFPESIELEGQKDFKITSNLALALRRLRHWYRLKTVWIDAVCINQSDGDERSKQVVAMGQIYQRAKRVLVWLGESDPQGRPAWWKSATFQRKVAFVSALMKTRPHWWKRIWVVQEYVLASRALIMFGPYKMTPKKFVTMAMSLINSVNLRQEVIFAADQWHFYREIWDVLSKLLLQFQDLAELHAQYRRNHNHVPLYTLLKHTLHAEATEKHDKVGAVLGLMTSAEKERINFGYNEPTSTIFSDATAASLLASQRLDILEFKSLRDSDNKTLVSHLPSWAVDFGGTSGPKYLELVIEPLFDRDDWVLANSPRIPYSREGETLAVQGRFFDSVMDVVSSLGSLYPEVVHANEYSQEKLDELKDQLATRIQLGHPLDIFDARSEPEQLAASKAQQISGRNGKSHSRTTVGRESIGISVPHAAKLPVILEFWENLSGHQTQPSLVPQVWDQIYQYEFYANTLSVHKRFFHTTSGFFGLGPSGMSSDDVVAFLDGGKLPVLLRPHKFDNGYEFRGFCWIHGTMTCVDEEKKSWVLCRLRESAPHQLREFRIGMQEQIPVVEHFRSTIKARRHTI